MAVRPFQMSSWICVSDWSSVFSKLTVEEKVVFSWQDEERFLVLVQKTGRRFDYGYCCALRNDLCSSQNPYTEFRAKLLQLLAKAG